MIEPETLETTEYSILFWDETLNDFKGGWIQLPILPDNPTTDDFHQLLHPDNPKEQRTIITPVHQLGDSRIQVSTNFTGIYILVQEE